MKDFARPEIRNAKARYTIWTIGEELKLFFLRRHFGQQRIGLRIGVLI